MKVSTLNRPRNVPLALSPPLVSRSPWYQERPNGAFGTWITNTSNSVLAGKPQALISSLSTGPSGVTVTLALALRRQPALVTAAERTMSNLSGAPACEGHLCPGPVRGLRRRRRTRPCAGVTAREGDLLEARRVPGHRAVRELGPEGELRLQGR